MPTERINTENTINKSKKDHVFREPNCNQSELLYGENMIYIKIIVLLGFSGTVL